MQIINSTITLKQAIFDLESNQAMQKQQLKIQLKSALESLNLVNSVKNSFGVPGVVGNVISTAIGLGAGYFSRKFFMGESTNIFKKAIGNLLQMGVSTIISNNPEIIMSLGHTILQRVFGKTEE